MLHFLASLSAIIGFVAILVKAATPSPQTCAAVAILSVFPAVLYALAEWHHAQAAMLPNWVLSAMWVLIMATAMIQRAALLNQ